MALLNLGITNCTSPGLISPYFYYYVIRKTPMKYWTNVNSSIFLATQLFNSLLVLFGGFLYSLCIHNEYLQAMAPFNKYITFVLFVGLNIYGINQFNKTPIEI